MRVYYIMLLLTAFSLLFKCLTSVWIYHYQLTMFGLTSISQILWTLGHGCGLNRFVGTPLGGTCAEAASLKLLF